MRTRIRKYLKNSGPGSQIKKQKQRLLRMSMGMEVLEQQLSGEEKNSFFAEQRSWVRDRESTAVSNSKRQNGSALEELEYIRSLRDITRERVYELAERYETILDGKKE